MLQSKLSEYSQVDVLKRKMEEAGFTHGKEARVSLYGVQVRRATESEGVVYFCNMEDIDVRDVVHEGDGGPLPEFATLENLKFANDGFHDLYDVILTSNGSLQLKADDKSRLISPKNFSWFNWFRRFAGQSEPPTVENEATLV